ncbi:hypothetical protein [Sphingorhabdus sp. Alg239-R122]|uniref:hypothetical protein n=1 Tax=Sphingorhabdus sp. Alg239-R122 TaxID=2305989 RepID=UPI0013DD24C9|nr:hypothetical protein [Sphingorhabdus sp. Alg239-R122]
MAYSQNIRAKACIAAALFSLACPAIAQETQNTPPPPAPAQTPPCDTPEHKQFNFWLGTWDVTPAGRDAPSATNILTSEHLGCVVSEDYTTKGGYTGMSMSFYDAARKVWHQTWIGRDGGALFIEGGLNDKGEMVLGDKGMAHKAKDAPISRVTWTPNADGSVRQHWQSSQDDGTTWTTVFDGLYTKKMDTKAKTR